MGVRHAREYSEILQELTVAIATIEDSYLFFEMEGSDWKALNKEAQKEVLEALADDVFYGLSEDHEIEVGSGKVIYSAPLHRIEVIAHDERQTIVHLI
jgi:hypothetical protein